MRCPFCAHDDSQVKDSRSSEDGASIRRRRQCEGCGARFTTFERVQLREVTVVKKDGAREAFDRQKLDRSIAIACRKRAIEPARIDRLVSAIQRQVETSGDGEVAASAIGGMVMAGLKALDPVAYIRFASVYKDFREARDFEAFAGSVAEPGEEVSRPPVIVLVRPQLGENIGKAARAMLNFGLDELRLVAPRDGWPNPDAGPAASGADAVLDGAMVFATLAEAVADCHRVYATTVRKRGLTKPIVTPEAAAGEIRASAGRVAVVFGPERAGLETDDVALAQAILTVPVNPAFGSLNLAQAVVLVAYEWAKAGGQPATAIDNYEGPAAQASVDGLVAQVDAALEAAGYYYVPARVTAAKRTLRNLFTRPGYSEKEVRTLRGIVHALVEGRRGARPKPD